MSAVRPHADMQYCLHALARRLAKKRKWTAMLHGNAPGVPSPVPKTKWVGEEEGVKKHIDVRMEYEV
ncbi:hypothetical protein Tco_0398629 [Tanacetum coccineum]